MLAINPARINLYQRYLDIIAEYNLDKDDVQIQRVFDELLKTYEALEAEDERYIREEFESDKQLAVFDLLAKDQKNLTKQDIARIKKVAREITDVIERSLRDMSSLRDRASAQAKMKIEISDRLVNGLPDWFSDSQIIFQRDAIYQHAQMHR